MNSNSLELVRDAISAIPFRWAPGDEPAAFLNVIDYVTLCIDDAVDLLALSRSSPVGVHNYEAEQRDSEDSPLAGSDAIVQASFGTVTIMANPWSKRSVHEAAERVEALVGGISDSVSPWLVTGLRRLRGPFKDAAPLRHRASTDFRLATDIWRGIFTPARERLDGLGVPHSFVTRFPAATRGEWTLCQSRHGDGQMVFECVENPTTEALARRCFRTGLLQHAGAAYSGRQLFVPIHYQGVAWAVVVLEFPDTVDGWTRAFYLYREAAVFASIRARTYVAQFELLDRLGGKSTSIRPRTSKTNPTLGHLPRLIFPNPHFGYRSADGSSVEADEEGPFQKSGMVLPVERSTPDSDALWAAVKRANFKRRSDGRGAAEFLPDPYVLSWSGDYTDPALRIASRGRVAKDNGVDVEHGQDVALLVALIEKKEHGTGLLLKEDIEKCQSNARERATKADQIIQAVRRSLREKGVNPRVLLKATHRTGVRLHRTVVVERRGSAHVPFGGLVKDVENVTSQEDEDRWRSHMFPRKRRSSRNRDSAS